MCFFFLTRVLTIVPLSNIIFISELLTLHANPDYSGGDRTNFILKNTKEWNDKLKKEGDDEIMSVLGSDDLFNSFTMLVDDVLSSADNNKCELHSSSLNDQIGMLVNNFNDKINDDSKTESLVNIVNKKISDFLKRND